VDPTTGALVAVAAPAAGAPETATTPITGALRGPDDIRPVSFVAGLPSGADTTLFVPPPDPTQRLGLLGEGISVGNIHLRAKGRLTISGVQALPEWVAGNWYVRKVIHVFLRGNETAPQVVPGAPPVEGNARYQSRFVVTQ
jgi:hypothetical protein